MDERCDRRANCEDGSDEQNCDIVEKGEGYSMQITPIFYHQSGMVLANITVDIEDILDINEVKEIFVVKFSVTRDWKDNGLTYINLKKNSSDLNALTSEEASSLWYPFLISTTLKTRKCLEKPQLIKCS